MERIRVDEVATLFGLLGEPNRLRLVLACLDAPRAVGDIAAEAGVSPSLASHHLRLLRTARLLRAVRSGKSVLYAVDDHHVADVLRMMVAHVCDPHDHPTDELHLDPGETDHV